MKTPLETFMAPYADWLNATWSMATGVPMAAKEAAPKAAQAQAEQDWEHEGGSLKP
jgi:hypothetical protein